MVEMVHILKWNSAWFQRSLIYLSSFSKVPRCNVEEAGKFYLNQIIFLHLLRPWWWWWWLLGLRSILYLCSSKAWWHKFSNLSLLNPLDHFLLSAVTQIVLMKKIYVGVDNIIKQMDDGLQVEMIFKMYVIEYEYEYYSGIFG